MNPSHPSHPVAKPKQNEKLSISHVLRRPALWIRFGAGLGPFPGGYFGCYLRYYLWCYLVCYLGYTRVLPRVYPGITPPPCRQYLSENVTTSIHHPGRQLRGQMKKGYKRAWPLHLTFRADVPPFISSLPVSAPLHAYYSSRLTFSSLD